MKFTFNRNALMNEIAMSQELIAEKKSTSSASYISLKTENNNLTIKAADSKISFVSKIPVETEVAGNTSVFGPKFVGILSQFPEGDICFELQNVDGFYKAVIKHTTKKIKFTIWCKSDLAEISDIDSNNLTFIDIPSETFKDMVSHTAFATSTDEKKMFMNGVHFEKSESNLILVSTDGKRLAYDARPLLAEINEFKSINVFPAVLKTISKHASDEGNISIATTDSNIIFKFANYVISSNLINGEFPSYKRIIPENQPSSFKVQRDEFYAAVKRISLMSEVMSDKVSVRIFFDITPGVLSIHAANTDGEAREEIPCEYAGENITIAMNFKNIDDAVKVMDSERIAFEFSEFNRPITFRPEPAASYFNILMPMQL